MCENFKYFETLSEISTFSFLDRIVKNKQNFKKNASNKSMPSWFNHLSLEDCMKISEQFYYPRKCLQKEKKKYIIIKSIQSSPRLESKKWTRSEDKKPIR